MTMRVLVSRPQPGAARTAARLAQCGCEAVVAPVLSIAATGEPAPAGPFDALILTSARAVPTLAPEPARWRAVPLFCVGERTAAAAAEAGFAHVHAGPGDARALAGVIARHVTAGARLLHVAGRERKPEPAASLTQQGFAVEVWTAYAALAAERLPDAAFEALVGAQLDGALHYSRRTAAVLVELVRRAGQMAALAALHHACLSADAARPLQAIGAERIAVAARPDEEALFAALQQRNARRARA
jgi:uroporphyrinogen-III synthase